jgi:hypothetical protein
MFVGNEARSLFLNLSTLLTVLCHIDFNKKRPLPHLAKVYLGVYVKKARIPHSELGDEWQMAGWGPSPPRWPSSISTLIGH